MWRIPLPVMNSLNSLLINWVPLSVTNSVGKPWVAKIERRLLIVKVMVADGSGTTSSHLEYESTTSKNILPRKGPAKSACSLLHVCFGNSHECSGAVIGLLRVF